MITTSFDRQFKVTSQGNLRLLIDPFTIKSPSSYINYGGGFVDMDDNSSGYVVVDSETLEAGVTDQIDDSTKVYLCIVQASQGVARIVKQFDNAPFFDTGGGSGDAPAVTAPFPVIGDEGEIYSQQIHTTGSAPQTFSVTSGAIPTGHTLGASSGIIFGQCDYPNGGLYTGTIHISNAYGSVDYDFEILVNGLAPAFVSGTLTPYSSAYEALAENQLTTTWSGSTGGSPAVPITFSFSSTPDPSWNASVNPATGVVTISPDVSLLGYYSGLPTLVAANHFGSAQIALNGLVDATSYWGEWHGALPGSFTEDNILIDLFNNSTPGPRILPVGQGMSTINPLDYPTTAVSYYRLLVLPTGFFSWPYVESMFPAEFLPVFLVDQDNPDIPTPTLTPAWPTPYQTGLDINGISYDVWVVTSRTDEIVLGLGVAV